MIEQGWKCINQVNTSYQSMIQKIVRKHRLNKEGMLNQVQPHVCAFFQQHHFDGVWEKINLWLMASWLRYCVNGRNSPPESIWKVFEDAWIPKP